MATTDLVPTSILVDAGWTGATVANLSASDDSRATDGDVEEVIKAELTDAPTDFGAQNSVTLKVEALVTGVPSRAKQLLVELLDSGDNVLESFVTTDIQTTEQVFSSTFTRSDSAATIDGYRLRVTIQETGGMPDAVTVEIDWMAVTLDYNLVPVFAANAYRFYEDDAAEDSSTPLDAQDTDVSVDTSSGDVAVQLRYRVDETNGGPGSSTDDWQLEVSKNSGADAAVTDASSNVKARSGSAVEASFSVAGEDSSPEGLSFKSDGTKLYVVGSTSDTIYQYPLSTAWDIATAGAVEASFSVANEETVPTGLVFKSDGTKLYIIGSISDAVQQYPLSVAWDVSSAGAVEASFSVAGEDDKPQGLTFKSDGTKLYVIGTASDTIYQYPLSVAWDVSTAGVVEASFSVASEDTGPEGLNFKSDGTKLYVAGNASDTIYQYPLSTAWDISTVGAVEASFSVAGQETAPNGVIFKSDGTKLYVSGSSAEAVQQYPVSTVWDISTVGGQDVSPLTDGSATTNRATNGISDPATGTFVAGEQEAGNGLIEDHQLTASNFTEHVWALTLVAADLADGDTLDFRLLRNGSPITNNVTPTITVSVSAGIMISMDLGSLTFSGQGNTVTEQTPVPMDAGTLDFAGQTASVTLDTNVPMNAGALTFAGHTNSVTRQLLASLDTGAFSLAGLDATTTRQLLASMDAGTLTFAGRDNSVTLSLNLPMDTGALTFAGLDPAVTRDLLLALDAGALTFDGLDNNVTLSINVPMDAAGFTLTSNDLDVVQALVLSMDAGTLTFTGLDPAVSRQLLAAMDAGNLTFAGQTANVTRQIPVDMALAPFTFSGLDPALTRSLLINPDTGAIIFNGRDADITTAGAIAMDVATFNFNGLDPALTRQLLAGMDAAGFTFTGHDPAVLLAQIIGMDAGNVAFNGHDLDLTTAGQINMQTGALVVTGRDLSLTRQIPVAMDAVGYALTGHDAAVDVATAVLMDAAGFTFQGHQAGITRALIAAMEAAGFTLTGFDPGVTRQIPVGMDAAAFSFTGLDADLTRSVPVAMDVATFTLNGRDFTLSLSSIFPDDTLPARIVAVLAETRVAAIGAETRAQEVAAETRTVTVPSSSRSQKV